MFEVIQDIHQEDQNSSNDMQAMEQMQTTSQASNEEHRNKSFSKINSLTELKSNESNFF